MLLETKVTKAVELHDFCYFYATLTKFKMKRRLFTLFGVFLISGTAFLVSCENAEKETNTVDQEVFDPNSRITGRFDNKLFSIPSPVQTSYLIKRLDISFNRSLLNDENKVNDYVTEQKQALNLGIYGADLGYAALYNEKATTIKYLSSIQKLTSQLGLDGAFDTSFYDRFKNQGAAGDSMILLMTDAFKKADFFLKESQRKPVTALILTGGWIESLYFACELESKNQSSEIRTRIGEQKRSLSSVIEILEEYNQDGANDSLITKLKGLQESFEKIKSVYTYSAPETDEEKHLTTFNHTLEVQLSTELLKEIQNKVIEIRNEIINA